jgi:hypothetical protein
MLSLQPCPHKFIRANDFNGLTALLRNFFQAAFSKSPAFWLTASDETMAHFVSCIDEPKIRENETNLSPGEMKRLARRS